jgi:uncharacterized membrane protein YqjE
METKQQVTKRFALGIALIIISLILGKLVLIPIIIFPDSYVWWTSMIIVYILSWVIILCGIYLAGIEGFRLINHKYSEYSKKTMTKMREGSRNMARSTVNALKKPIRKLDEKQKDEDL